MDAIDRVLQEAVEAGVVPHVAAIAADRDGTVYEGSAGGVSTDTTFRIMSMTKMVATTAALQQVEQGRLNLDAPVDDYCPSFRDVQVLTGFDGDEPILKPPATRATVRQLVTHTTGLGYWFWNADVLAWETATGTPNVLSGSEVIFTAPMVAEPGSQYVYGINTDWLGKVVEAASGDTLDVAVKEGITGPLGMDRTTFAPTSEALAAAVPIHVKGDDGWVATDVELSRDPEYYAGGHGLYSTPRDYIRFERALLRGGELDGQRILRESTVAEAFTNQIGDLDFPAVIPTADPASACTFEVPPGMKWGLGLLLNPEDEPGRRRAWSGSWAGLCNTHFWVDPTTGVCASIYSNFLPFATPEAMALYADFERALYASL
ncbi:serine hydrolase [Pseudonocardia sp. WMMC193]|uniref:serine hydrolase domain-containing protein n=1 Tax=Pseudonocardia sp. WMMC193 TaxID=2911965 RepID=UPI001F2BB034|nr:serine hydrolase domain-containing protein [Pseudonocardia sp. WMMC193]MCF7548093.1 beta-lactamase family protein [Pseudonocardia sp. WMMC193]